MTEASIDESSDLTSALYRNFDRDRWRELRASTPLTLSESDLATIQGLNEKLRMDEVAEIYLPLSRLLSLHVAANRLLARVRDTFLHEETSPVPYVIGLAGSVAVGKSTTARLLQALLSRWPEHPRVELVTTDGFLFPNAVLEARGLMKRKGFPESYDIRRLLRFVSDLKSGLTGLSVPVYSHVAYDIMPDTTQAIPHADIVIIEGLTVLQTGTTQGERAPRMFVSDFFDFSIYVDASLPAIKRWYIERFLALRAAIFTNPSSYFHRYASLSESEAVETATRIWREINEVNLRENIQPTRSRAHLVLQKGPSHAVERVFLRKR